MNLTTPWKWAAVLAAFHLSGCATRAADAPPVEDPTGQARAPLYDFSGSALGRGYDRALDIERSDCFIRAPKTVTPINEWAASGFLASSQAEVETKVKLNIDVGATIEGVATTFGVQTSSRIDNKENRSLFVMAVAFKSHMEAVGQVTGALPSACGNITVTSANGMDEFVSSCGDRYLKQKTYGGHLLLSARSVTNNYKRERAFSTNFGAAAEGVKFDAKVALDSLVSAGYGSEEIYLEVSGMPFPPSPVALPNGGSGFTVKSVLDYLQQMMTAGGTTPSPFARVISYEMARHTVPEIDLCLGVTGAACGLSETEWGDCIYPAYSELADTRDAIGERADLAKKFELAKLAELLMPMGRIQFTTVLQSKCPNHDADGDPNVEASGPCQEEALHRFVDHFGACQKAAKAQMLLCRGQVLGSIKNCADFTSVCTPTGTVLPDGTPVECTKEGLEASANDVVPYITLEARPKPPAGAQITDAFTLSFTETARTPIPNVSPATHLCAMTGVRGGLHESTAWVMPDGPEWVVEVHNATQDPAKAITMEVTCIERNRFLVLNGGTVDDPNIELVPVDPGNDIYPFHAALVHKGQAALNGWRTYLSEWRTSLTVTNPTATDFADYLGTDQFPFVSTTPVIGTYVIRGNPSPTGTIAGTPVFGVPGAPSMPTVGLDLTRVPNRTAVALPSNAFCYLTGLSGHWYNVSDSVRIDRSLGMTTLTTTTPIAKDRNPGGRAQCLLLDQ